MKSGGAGKVWAQALLEAATGRGTLDSCRQGVALLAGVADAEPWFRAFLGSPELPSADKKEAIARALGPALDPLLVDFLGLLADRGRGAILPEILERFVDLYNDATGRAVARVWTVSPLSPELKAEVAGILSEMHGKTVDLDERTDPDILGGVIVQIGDRRIDSSLRRALQEIGERMLRARIDSGAAIVP